KEYENSDQSSVYGESNKNSDDNDNVNKKRSPAKVLWSLRIISRFKRLFANASDAKNIRCHPYCRLRKAFNGELEFEIAHKPLMGREVYQQQEHGIVVFGNNKKGLVERNIWKKRSVLFDFPYRCSQDVVAELRTMNWLEIQGKIRTNILTPDKLYGAYLVMKVSHRAYGLDSTPSEISIRKGEMVKRGKAYTCTKDENKSNLETFFYGNRRNRMVQEQEDGENVGVPCKREDGWMEIEIGEFLSGEGDEEEIEMSVAEVGHQLKGGLVLEGIEVRPKHA
ncbi:F-box protein PP2-B13-like, partial [Vicia villosa]|uniref:F-box protein PP2-B13-like n=1 Tax=Vicia villosa TaxID=3911 RepID=UPI00273A86ED